MDEKDGEDIIVEYHFKELVKRRSDTLYDSSALCRLAKSLSMGPWMHTDSLKCLNPTQLFYQHFLSLIGSVCYDVWLGIRRFATSRSASE